MKYTESCLDAINAGAKFIVSPGLNPKVVKYCVEKNIPVTPGIITPSEMEQAIELGLEVVKFFPAEAMGGVMTDLQGRRAIVMGMDSEGKYQIIRAKAPLAEMNRYSTALSSLTSGRGTFSMSYAEYQQVPTDVQQALLKAYEEQEANEE